MAKKAIRPIRIEGNVAYVPLTQGYEAIIDAEDVPLVDGCNWFALVKPNTVYAVRSKHFGGERRASKMHRVLLACAPGLEVDHADGNGLNNRRDNLRPATIPQNRRNAKMRSDNSSGKKGVNWDAQARKWRARIMVDGKSRFLGVFRDLDDAAKAYAKASAELHGLFGRIG